MPTDMPAALAGEGIETGAAPQSATAAWIETALTVVFAVAAVLFASFLAVVTGLV